MARPVLLKGVTCLCEDSKAAETETEREKHKVATEAEQLGLEVALFDT